MTPYGDSLQDALTSGREEGLWGDHNGGSILSHWAEFPSAYAERQSDAAYYVGGGNEGTGAFHNLPLVCLLS